MDALSADKLAQAEASLLTNVVLPEGRKFRPDWYVSRADLAGSLVRAGSVPQFVAAAPMFTDVKDAFTRGAVESVQSNPGGRMIYDAAPGGRFYPNNAATKLAAAIAFVKAAGLDGAAATAVLPITVADAAFIPAEWRGYVAAALQNGLISLDGNRFNASRAVTRIELAQSMNAVIGR
jgi:hypothetical protein